MFIQIDCDKSIKKLVIEFDEYNDSDSDEHVVKKITSSLKDESKKSKTNGHKSSKDVPLVFDNDDSEQTFEIVQKPQIEDINRTPNVSPDMQNLEF